MIQPSRMIARGLALALLSIPAAAQAVQTPLVAAVDADSEFGFSVDTDGLFAVVGAPGQRVGGVQCGAVFVFEREPSGWALRAQLLGPAPRYAGYRFGHSVGLDGESLVVTSGGSDAYPFHRYDEYLRYANGNWAWQGQGGPFNDRIHQVQRSEDRIIAVSRVAGQSAWNMAILRRQPLAPASNRWQAVAGGEWFLSPANLAVVIDGSGNYAGSYPAWLSTLDVNLFGHGPGPDAWSWHGGLSAASVLPADPAAEFFFAAAMDGGRLLVGSPGASHGGLLPSSAGVVSVFGGNSQEPLPLELLGHLDASDAAPGRRFGSSVDLSGDLALLGDQSAAYVFQETAPGSWVELEKLTPGWADLTSTSIGSKRAVLSSVDGSTGAGVVSVFEFPGLNTPPVADGGPDQAAELSDTVVLSGTGSFDVDGDALGYFWQVASKPAGSFAEIVGNPRYPQAMLIPDLPGLYVVQLVVDDGVVPGLPDSVAVLVTQSLDGPFDALRAAVDGIRNRDFTSGSAKQQLRSLLDDVDSLLWNDQYADALATIQDDLIPRIDGCSTSGGPDGNDWIEDCGAQQLVLDQLQPVLDILVVLAP